MSLPGLAVLSSLLSGPKAPPPTANPNDPPPPDPGIDPETLLKAEQAFSQKYSQIGGPPEIPAEATQPPPFVADQTPTSVPAPAASNQTMPLDAAPQASPQTSPAPELPSAGPAGAPTTLGDQTLPNEAAPAAQLGPPPAPPQPTGDPGQDYQNTIAWHRQLTDYQQQAQAHGNDLAAQRAELEKKKTGRELEVEQNAATIRNDEQKRFAEERQRHQTEIDKAVTEKADAYKDLSKGNGFLDQSLGDKVLGAIIFMLGSRSAALQNVAAAQLGQVGNAQNEGLNTINRIMAQRYQQKKDRLAQASDAVMQARYGYKDAAENHRAATVDLDSDLAANYRLAAKEAASQGAQLGTEEARQNGIMASTALLQKAAETEGKMLQEREALGVHRETAAATQATAKAHYDQAERQIEATQEHNKGTLALGWAGERDRHEDRQAALAAKREADAEKAAAKKTKEAEDLDKRTLRDPDTGDPIVELSRPGAVDKAANQLTASRAYSKGLRELADDAEKNGRVAPAFPVIGNITEASKVRDENYGNVIARGRKALELGVSNNNLQIEHQNVGGSGKGFSSMPSPAVLRKMADDNDAFANERLRSSGKALGGGVPPKEPTGGAPSAPGRQKDAASAPPAPVIDQAWRAVNDPKAPAAAKAQAMKALTAAGLL